jgi:hypothetical protein
MKMISAWLGLVSEDLRFQGTGILQGMAVYYNP